ncbi:MAG: DUF1501 domain-containing protein [Chitinophagales bacterium]
MAKNHNTHHHHESKNNCCEPKKENMRHGAKLEDGKAHAKDHKRWSRRQFLTAGLTTLGGSLFLGNSTVKALASSPLLAALDNAETDRVLVLIRLGGGNDGLNTIIPLNDYSTYLGHRPDIAIPEAEIINLDADGAFGMPNTMAALEPLWLEGKMKVIHNVAYGDQNFSHFRSSDIWASASESEENLRSGWLGRFFEQEYPSYLSAPPTIPPAIQIGSESNLAFRGDNSNMSLVINDPDEFYQIAQTGQLYSTESLPECKYGSELGFMRTVANSSFRYSETIKNAYDASTNDVVYPDENFAEELGIISRLIKGNLGTKVYMATLGGFDTHSDQIARHATLMNRLSGSVKAFYDDLAATNQSQNVLMVTFSEFGRRVLQNGSLGTDHGEGAPMLLFGDGLNGNGLEGTAPDISLEALAGSGNIDYDNGGTDFKSIYATLLQDWLCLDPLVVNAVLGNDFSRMENLMEACQPSLGSNETAVLLGHQRNPAISGAYLIKYAVLVRGTVKVMIQNTAGQTLTTILNDFREAGSYNISFKPSDHALPTGYYIYKIEAGGRNYSRPIRAV